MTEKSAPTENVDRLHEHEEKLRAESLALIAKRMDLTDHWKLVQEAMNVIYAFANDHVHGSDDELTCSQGGAAIIFWRLGVARSRSGRGETGSSCSSEWIVV